LSLSEIFTEPKPVAADKAALERYEMRLGAAETDSWPTTQIATILWMSRSISNPSKLLCAL